MTDWPLLLWRGTSSPAGFCRGRGGVGGRCTRQGRARSPASAGARRAAGHVRGCARWKRTASGRPSPQSQLRPQGDPYRDAAAHPGAGRAQVSSALRTPPRSSCPLRCWGPSTGTPSWRAGARARGGRDMRGPGPPRTWPPRRTPRDLPAQGGRDGAGPVTFRKDARSWFERARDTGRLVSRPKREAPVGYGGGNGGRRRRRGTLRARQGRGRRRGSHGPETPLGSGDPNAACTSRGGRFGICDLRPRVQGLVYSMPTHV